MAKIYLNSWATRIYLKTLNDTNLVASRHIKREQGELPVDIRQSKTLMLKN